MTEVSNEYMEDLKIDEQALDLEWLDQPRLFMKWAKRAADAQRAAAAGEEKVVRAEEKVKQVKARLMLEGEGGNKDTREAAVRSSKVHQSAKNEWLDSMKDRDDLIADADTLRNAQFAFVHRRQALEYLVTLHGQSYFASPRLPRNLQEERANWGKAQAATAGVGDRMDGGQKKRERRSSRRTSK